MTEIESTALGDQQTWRDVVTDAVDVLLRQAERRMTEDSKVVVASRDTRQPGWVGVLAPFPIAWSCHPARQAVIRAAGPLVFLDRPWLSLGTTMYFARAEANSLRSRAKLSKHMFSGIPVGPAAS